MVQVLLLSESTTTTTTTKRGGARCHHNGHLHGLHGRKLFMILLVGIAIWNNQLLRRQQSNSSNNNPSTTSTTTTKTTTYEGHNQIQRVTTSTTTNNNTNDDINNNNSNNNVQRTTTRLSREELLDVLSPPNVNHSQFFGGNTQKKPIIKGMMVKCNVDKWSTYIMRELYYLYDGLIQIYGWEEINLDQLRQMANNDDNDELELLPDVLFLCEPSILYLDYILPWLIKLKAQSKNNIQIIYHTDDLQSAMNKVDSDLFAKAFELFDTYMGTYAYEIQHYLKNVPISPTKMPNIIWIPHSVSPEFFINNNMNNNNIDDDDSSSLTKTTQQQQQGNNNMTISTNVHTNKNNVIRDRIVLPGKINSKYPIRMWALDESSSSSSSSSKKLQNMLDIMKHNGYNKEHNSIQQINFANEISKYATAFTCSSIYHYIVSKMFEIPSVQTLLIVNNDVNDLLESIGFVDGIHYISYSSMNPIPTLEWAINSSNINEIDTIRHNGYKLVQNYHQVGHRLEAIMSWLVKKEIKYKIPTKFKSNPCPILTFKDEESCLYEYHQRTTKPMLPVV